MDIITAFRDHRRPEKGFCSKEQGQHGEDEPSSVPRQVLPCHEEDLHAGAPPPVYSGRSFLLSDLFLPFPPLFLQSGIVHRFRTGLSRRPADHACGRYKKQQRRKKSGHRQDSRAEDLKPFRSAVPAQVLRPQYPREKEQKEPCGQDCPADHSGEQHTEKLSVIDPADLLLCGPDHMKEPHLTDVSRHGDLHHVMDQEEHPAQDHKGAKRRHPVSAHHLIDRLIGISIRYSDLLGRIFHRHVRVHPLFRLTPVHPVRLPEKDIRFRVHIESPVLQLRPGDISRRDIFCILRMICEPSAEAKGLRLRPEQPDNYLQIDLHPLLRSVDSQRFKRPEREHDLLLLFRIGALDVRIGGNRHLLPGVPVHPPDSTYGFRFP